MELPKDIKDEIWDYCRLNDITDLNGFITKVVKNGFTSEKFGSTPWDKPVEVKEVEVIKEIIKEVIVEKEVPVEVIREVVVEKEVFVTDNEANIELQKELESKSNELIETIKDFHNERTVNTESNKEFLRDIEKLTKENSRLTSDISRLENELETEKNKPKQVKEDDIYGGKKGYLGSNTSDLWDNKKQ